VDANHNIADGCEYQCTPSGSEVCDGKDNDCNGLIDEKDPALLYPSNFCSQIGECGKGPGGSKHAGWEGAATFPVCTNATGAPVSASPTWLCNYPSTVQLSAPNEIVGQETWCDGLDNDCNGVIDDPYVGTLGTLCSDASSTAVGACRRQGTMRCQTDKSQAPACDFTGVPPTPDPTNEICDGIDNDCDGLVDESWDNPQGLALCNGKDCLGVRDAVVAVNAASAPGGSYYIYKYEASRSDANATSPGVSTTRACSRAVTAAATPVLPWSSTTWNQADAACKAAGMRLCRVTRTGSQIMTDEWGFACRAGQTCTGDTFPYSCTYDAKACNGLDSNLGTALACGANPACSTTGDLDTTSSNDAIFDMSGNLAEWTDDRRDILDTTGSPAGSGSASAIYTMRGGAFDSFFRGMACDFMGTQLHPSFSQPDTGFRCCSSCPPGQADCSGSCRNLATDTANCGSCALACKAGTSCQNGTCK
jgi:hypothetical protein